MLVSKEQITLPDGQVVNVGTITDAAGLCATARSPNGVLDDTYRYYRDRLGAPGPLTIADPLRPGRTTVVRDVAGREVYDLDAVRAWNRSRPGSGGRGNLSVVRRTELREAMLSEVKAGRVLLDPTSGKVLADRLQDERLTSAARAVPGQVLTDLQLRELVSPVDEFGRVRLSETGAELLARWLAT